MAEFTNSAEQNVLYGQAAILNRTNCGCNKGYILHRDGSGLVTLRGIVNNPYSNFARYEVEYACNIALADGATVGEIGVALAVNGEALPDTYACVTPAAVGDFWHVSGFVTLDVPRGCCPTVSLENASPQPTAAAPSPEIVVRNLNLAVNRIA